MMPPAGAAFFDEHILAAKNVPEVIYHGSRGDFVEIDTLQIPR